MPPKILKRISEEIELEKEFKIYNKHDEESIEELFYIKDSQIEKMSWEIEKLKKIIEIENQAKIRRKKYDEANKKLLLESMCGILESKYKISEKLRNLIKGKEGIDEATSPLKVDKVDVACSTIAEIPKVAQFKAGVIKNMTGNIKTRKASRKNIN